MAVKKIKSVCFTEHDKEILNLANSKPNFSEYIKSLLRKELKNGEELSEGMKKAIRTFIQENYDFKRYNFEEKSEEKVDSKVLMALDDLLNTPLKKL